MLDIETMFEQYRDDVYRLALSYTKSVQEAEDVCQTVFLKLMEQKRIEPGKERAWLMQVTANRCSTLVVGRCVLNRSPLNLKCTFIYASHKVIIKSSFAVFCIFR